MSHPCRLRPAGTIVPGVDVRQPTAAFTLDLPEGYRVVTVTTGAGVSGSESSTSSEVVLNVLAEHAETGERVLLIYQGVETRTAPVAVFRF